MCLYQGAEIKPLATLPVNVEKRQAESLTDEENDLEWAGTISIGTPAQSFLIDFDSAVSLLIPLKIVANIHINSWFL